MQDKRKTVCLVGVVNEKGDVSTNILTNVISITDGEYSYAPTYSMLESDCVLLFLHF